MKKHIIGLTGLAGVGKDTVADLLITHCGFRKLAFADALRVEVAEGFGIDIRLLTDPATKNEPTDALALSKCTHRPFLYAVIATLAVRGDAPKTAAEWAIFLAAPRSPRQIMQWWATEYRRTEDPRYWTRQLLQRVVDYQRDGAMRLIVTDCRFANEVDTLYAMGGLLWQVTRPGVNPDTTPEGKHVSATDGSHFKPSIVIANAYDIRHLQQLVLSDFFALETGIPSAKVTVAE